MKVMVRGAVYESVREAAQALGMSEAGVYGAIERGKADLLGLGKTSPKKTVIAGVEFRSLSAASEALGFNRRFLQDTWRGGSKQRRALVDAAIAIFTEQRQK